MRAFELDMEEDLGATLERLNQQMIQDVNKHPHGRPIRAIINGKALRCSCDDFYAKSGADRTTVK